MSDLEQTAIERLKATSDMSLRLFEKPLVITYSGGKDSDVLLHLAEASGIAYNELRRQPASRRMASPLPILLAHCRLKSEAPHIRDSLYTGSVALLSILQPFHLR